MRLAVFAHIHPQVCAQQLQVSFIDGIEPLLVVGFVDCKHAEIRKNAHDTLR